MKNGHTNVMRSQTLVIMRTVDFSGKNTCKGITNSQPNAILHEEPMEFGKTLNAMLEHF